MASPPKPWERPGATAATAAAIPSITAAASPVAPATNTVTSTSSSAAPPVPDRPSSLTSTVNQNASAYSRVGGVGGLGAGASPYSAYGGAYSSPYSSPYSRFGGMGGMGGMGGYGGGMYGGYGGYGGIGGYGGGMYGGMGMNPNDPNSLTSRFSNGTAATFQMLEGIVTAFGGFAQMLESTYMATHSSFFAMVSVAEQFGNLRDTLGSILGIFTLMRWIRTLIAKITGRPPPADALALTPAAFAHFEGRGAGPDGTPGPAKASRKPLFFFLAAAFGIPYLMSKMIRTLAASQEEEERRLQQQALEQQQPVDPSKLEFCRLVYDYLPQGSNVGMELEARKGDLVAVLTKNDPAGQPSEWWQCRARDGRQGYLPATYLEVLKRPGQEVKKIMPAPGDGTRTNSMTSTSEAPQDGKKEYATADGMQRSHFYS
ncbi:Peroxisomal membrane protein PAS20 [Conoideocrella luteorostrata]|uniref:Peroxisomal membrane protein PEX13 n=1 Tax=Conoideocrella luteorostrata TaxID=1105319 RepID=A0AAJ0CKR4_9HYPO|nr:Peroxisomal membrane protein PAS20 [Conoideocrella luteorostrata]